MLVQRDETDSMNNLFISSERHNKTGKKQGNFKRPTTYNNLTTLLIHGLIQKYVYFIFLSIAESTAYSFPFSQKCPQEGRLAQYFAEPTTTLALCWLRHQVPLTVA